MRCLILSGLTIACLVSLLGCDDGYQATELASSSEYVAKDVAGGTQLVYQLETEGKNSPEVSRVAGQNKLLLIYTTDLRVVVDDLDGFVFKAKQVIEDHSGFVASNQLQSATKNARAGSWVIRIPSDKYAVALQQLSELGQVESISEKTKNVTEEYVDLDARITNAHRLEERIIKLVEDRTGKLSDVLEIERELARVRESIEVMEGRMRYLGDQTSLATITIHAREQQDYKPPAPLTLSSQVAATWTRSMDGLRQLGVGLLLMVTAFVPWLIVIAPIALLTILGIRNTRQKSS